MLERIRVDLRETGVEISDFTDNLAGRLVLRKRDSTGNTVTEVYDRFEVSIIRYLANWEIAGTASPQQGPAASFSLALDEKTNIVVLAIDRRIWSIPTEDGSLRVINAYGDGQLSLRFLRDTFSSNEPSWRIGLESVLFAVDN